MLILYSGGPPRTSIASRSRSQVVETREFVLLQFQATSYCLTRAARKNGIIVTIFAVIDSATSHSRPLWLLLTM